MVKSSRLSMVDGLDRFGECDLSTENPKLCRHLILDIMAPNLAHSQHDLIYDMVVDKKMKVREMANVAECSERSIMAIRSNIRHIGSTKAPPNGGGRLRSITPQMLEVLCEHLLERPGLYLEEMAVFLWDEFDVLVSPFQHQQGLKIKKLVQEDGSPSG